MAFFILFRKFDCESDKGVGLTCFWLSILVLRLCKAEIPRVGTFGYFCCFALGTYDDWILEGAVACCVLYISRGQFPYSGCE